MNMACDNLSFVFSCTKSLVNPGMNLQRSHAIHQVTQTSWIPLSRMCRHMNRSRSVLHQTRAPPKITIHRTTTRNASSISRVIIVQRIHQGRRAFGSRSIANGHITRWGSRKERVLRDFFLSSKSMPGRRRTLSGGRGAIAGEILLTHNDENVLCIGLGNRTFSMQETGRRCFSVQIRNGEISWITGVIPKRGWSPHVTRPR